MPEITESNTSETSAEAGKFDLLSDLLACPFCGKTPQIKHNSGSYGYTPNTVSISCCHGLYISSPTEDYDWEKRKHFTRDAEAIKEVTEKWNARAG